MADRSSAFVIARQLSNLANAATQQSSNLANAATQQTGGGSVGNGVSSRLNSHLNFIPLNPRKITPMTADPQISHMVYFALEDNSAQAIAGFLADMKNYLDHP